MDFREKLHSKIILFDGAMGTSLQSHESASTQLPETLNLEAPELVTGIHKSYIDAGAQVITTNTFGANRLKLKQSGYEVEAVITAAVKNAKTARNGSKASIALSIGPLGSLLEPMGTTSFTEAYQLFQEQVITGVKQGVDAILIETMTDLYEAKIAVLAAKENSNLPVICSMSFEAHGRTFMGHTLPSIVMVLEGLGVDALGVNCSVGPQELAPIVEELVMISQIPILVQANAGLPTIIDGKTIYNLTPNQFATYGRTFVEKGVSLIGGCCGTTAAHILELQKILATTALPIRKLTPLRGVCTPSQPLVIDMMPEFNSNPIELTQASLEEILESAFAQMEAGAKILDLKIDLSGELGADLLVKAIKKIQAVLPLPLRIHTLNPVAIDQGLRILNGKAIIDLPNQDWEKNLPQILPSIKKYGAAISATVDRRETAALIRQAALDYRIKDSDLWITIAKEENS